MNESAEGRRLLHSDNDQDAAAGVRRGRRAGEPPSGDHFERARAWKQSLLAVATEEMSGGASSYSYTATGIAGVTDSAPRSRSAIRTRAGG